MKSNYNYLIGVPYENMNCWDIAVSFYSNFFEINLGNIYSGPVPSRPDTEKLISSNKGDFIRVRSPVFGDIVLLKIFGVESHIAICLGEGKMLHTSKSHGSVVERIDRFQKVISGYYRHWRTDT